MLVVPKLSDDDAAPATFGGRTEVGVIPNDGFDGIGIVRGNERPNESAEIENEADLLRRP
jgi:hypothetical protein